MFLDNYAYKIVNKHLAENVFEDYVSEGIDPTKSNKSRECMICHYLSFNHGFKFQDYVCTGCHDLTI